MVKVTFTLDDATVKEIRRTAERLGRPQSQVVREAVAEYAARADQVTERERLHAVTILENLKKTPSSRAGSAVDTELRLVRTARRTGGRRTAR
jgi:predicted transcriptional regulator